MDIGFFKDLVREGVYSLEINGKPFYLRRPSALDGNFVEIMTDKELDQNERLIMALTRVLCDESGQRTLRYDNPEHVQILKSLNDEYLVPLIDKMNEIIFVSKKK